MRISWRSFIVLPIVPKKSGRATTSGPAASPAISVIPEVTRFTARLQPGLDGAVNLEPDPRGRYMLWDDYRDVVIATENEGLQGQSETPLQARIRLVTWGVLILVLLLTGIFAVFHGFKPYLIGAAAGVILMMLLSPERRHA